MEAYISSVFLMFIHPLSLVSGSSLAGQVRYFGVTRRNALAGFMKLTCSRIGRWTITSREPAVSMFLKTRKMGLLNPFVLDAERQLRLTPRRIVGD
jgi:hypothetical protein